MLENILVFTTIALNLILALVVVLDNHKRRTNRTLALLASSLSLWIIGIEVSNWDTHYAVFWNRFVFLGPLLVVFFYYVFLKDLLSFKKHVSEKIIYYSTLFLSGFIFTPYVVRSVQPRLSTTGELLSYDLSRGFGYFFYILYFLTASGYILSILLRNYNQGSALQRIQLQFIILGTSTAIAFGILFNIILPSTTGSSVYASFGSLSSLLISGSMFYVIIKHKFLDVRFFVTRFIAYALLTVTLSVSYSAIIFGISRLFFDETVMDTSQQLIQVSVAVFLAFTFQPIKRFFDRVTNSIFYRDGYDTQEKLKSLGEVLAEEIEIEIVSKKVVDLLGSTLKASVTQLIVLDSRKVFYDYSSKDNPSYPSISSLEKLNSTINLYDDSKGSKTLFRKHNIDLVAKIETQGELIGFLLLGPKSSGSIYTSQDIELLTIASKELAIALENAKNFAEIEAFNETLKKKIKTATNNLRKKNMKLRELDQAKDDFISMASHQLRTPLTTIKGYLSMLSDGDFGDLTKKQQEITSLAFASSERMVYLISDLLNVSRIDTGKFIIEPGEVDLVKVVKEEVEQLQRSASAKGLTLSFKLPKNFPSVMLDETKTRQVIMNFIDNAIYYTPEGSIEVELKSDKDSIEFRVKDTGIGVPEEARQDLFTKFYRAENARKTRPDGTGLGLFMAKKVISSQGGSIIFRSEEGKGSTFGFRFSLAAIGAKKSTGKD